MKLKTKLFLGLGSIAIAITPAAILASCADNKDSAPSTPVGIFEKAINDSFKVNSFSNKTPINLANATISEENQKAKIIDYIKTTTTVQNITANAEGIYTFSMSAGTNTVFSKVFGKNWSDLVTNSTNEDVKKIKQIVFGFKLELQGGNVGAIDAIVDYKLSPLYLQFTFNDGQKPSWVTTDTQRVNISKQGGQKIQIKNTATA